MHNANGFLPDGTPWINMGNTGGEHGPWGASRHGDAESSMAMYLANTIAPAVEAIEAESPVVLMRKEYVTDSSGAGLNRGGSSVRKDSYWLLPAEHYSMPLHVKEASGVGVNGGGDGSRGAVWKFDPDGDPGWVGTDAETYRDSDPIAGMLDPQTRQIDGEGQYFYFAREPVWRTDAGAIFRYQTGGGGGWGDPLEREPERVLIDVRDEYVSIEAAKDVYGVIVDGDPEADPLGLTIDAEATARIRAERAR
jgi:N-methylhydantoinase B